MKKAVVLAIATIAVVVDLVFRPFGGDQATTSTPTPTPGVTTASPKPNGGGQIPGMTSPTADPGTPAGKVAAGIANIGSQGPVRVQFNGLDGGGTLAFDVVTDGKGHLSGSYRRGDQSGNVVVIGTAIYMQGAGVITSYTGIPVDPSVTGWVQLPGTYSAGFLGTLASLAMTHSCLDGIRRQYDTWKKADPQMVGGVSTPAFAPSMSTPTPWIFAIQDGPTPVVVAVDFVTYAGLQTPAVCTGGTVGLQGPTAGPAGELTFAQATGMAPITAPAPVQPMPTLTIEPDPNLPSG